MFWIWCEDTVGGTLMGSAVAGSCLYSVKDFPGSGALPARGLEGHGELGGDTARTADPNQPKRHSIPYDIMLSV